MKCTSGVAGVQRHSCYSDALGLGLRECGAEVQVPRRRITCTYAAVIQCTPGLRFTVTHGSHTTSSAQCAQQLHPTASDGSSAGGRSINSKVSGVDSHGRTVGTT
eukprot:577842-Rhodomonas_salina.1